MNGMTEFLRAQTWSNRILLIIGFGCLVATAVQYPLSTTFPIGGDAAVHIYTVQHMFSQPITTSGNILKSWYPVSYILFGLNGLIPNISWTTIFPWWMALGQIITGCLLGLLAYRLSGIPASAIAMGIWATTPIAMTSFFEDGTMAQLWSLPWILLFFERMATGSLRGMALYSFLALFSHPITGAVLIGTLVLAVPQLWMEPYPNERQQKARLVLSWVAAVSIIAASLILLTKWSILFLPFKQEGSRYIPELLNGSFTPWILASILGCFVILRKHAQKKILLINLGNFFFLAFFLAVNDKFGIGFWTNRLNSYLVLIVCISATAGIGILIKHLRSPILSTIVISFVLIGSMGSTYHDNQNIYKRYESPIIYSRLHPEELAALTWIRDSTPLHTIVLSSAATRHYEWIPILAQREWEITSQTVVERMNSVNQTNTNIIIFFQQQEKVPEYIRSQPNIFSLTYETKGAAIFSIKPTI